MPVFTNFATLSYNGEPISSNIVTGEILETVSVSKTAVTEEYALGDKISYVVSLVNSGDTQVTGITVSDDLGAYEFDGQTLYPLSYVADSLKLFVNGVLQRAPAVTAGPPLVVSGLDVPANGSTLMVYEAEVTAFAPLGPESVVTNIVTVSGGGISTALTASASIATADAAELSISKALSPLVVSANGEITYSFLITNTGNLPAGSEDAVVLRDDFDPVLTDISVSFNGVPWAAGVNYSYDESSGAFSTLPGQITVPAAGYTRNADHSVLTVPGTALLEIKGTLRQQGS